MNSRTPVRTFLLPEMMTARAVHCARKPATRYLILTNLK